MDFNKPRLAIYYHVLPSTGWRNDGAPIFLNYNFRKILNGKADMDSDIGNVVHLWPNKDAEKYGKFDLHVWPDYGEDALNLPLDWYPPSPNAYLVSDAHLGYEYRLETAKKFDFVFVAQRAFVDQFVRDGIDRNRIFYMPHAVEADFYKPHSIIERWDWCFIGHLNNPFRIELLDRFCRKWPVGHKGYLGWRMPEVYGHNIVEDVAKKFSQSRIILNESVKDDLNMRTFEALACKRCLLTEDIPELSGIFENMKHLVTFKTIEEAVDLAKWLLSRPEERETIAENGYAEVLAKHTYNHRAKEILKTCLQYVPEESEALC